MLSKKPVLLVFLFSVVLFFSLIDLEKLINWIPYRYDNAFHLQSLKAWLDNPGFMNLRFWQTATGFGEVRFLNYFPLPFLIAKGLSYVMSPTFAWNIVTFAPLWLMPVAAYKFFQTATKVSQHKKAFMAKNSSVAEGLIGASASIVFLYASEFTFWGGGLIGQMYGMVGHGWALVFIILLTNEILKDSESSLFKVVCFGLLTTLSHVAVTLAIPFVFLLHNILLSDLQRKAALKKSVEALGMISLAAAFYWVPFVLNFPYVFHVSARDGLYTFWQEELVPLRYLVILVSAILVFIFSIFRFKENIRSTLHRLSVTGYVFLIGIGPLVVTKILGLFWTRTLPLVYLTVLFSCFMLFSHFLSRLQKTRDSVLLKTVLILGLVKLSLIHGRTAILQVDRNYILPSTMQEFSYELNSVVSKGRPYQRIEGAMPTGIEQSKRNYLFNWHTIPMYLDKPIASTLHVESSHTNRYWMYFRGLIGASLYCYPGQMKCPPSSSREPVSNAMHFLGIDRLIVPDESFGNLSKLDEYLFADAQFKPWTLVGSRKEIKLVDVIDVGTVDIHTDVTNFYKVVEEFQGNFPAIMNVGHKLNTSESVKWKLFTFGEKINLPKNLPKSCKPELQVNQDTLDLKTNCPGHLHRIKFSYNPALVADSGERLYAIDPGFIAIMPKSDALTLRLGDPWPWVFSRWISILTLMWLVLGACGVQIRLPRF